jgi:hypothetical protein
MPFSAPSLILQSTSGLKMDTEQSANFTAAKFKEYPVDMSAFPSVSQLVVTPPSSPVVDDSFAVFDSRRVCTSTRTIIVDFTGSSLHSVPNDYAVINGDGDRIEFTYVNAVIGWRVAANVN